MQSITIRKATASDLNNILLLFRQTIETVNSKDYSPEQVKVRSNGATKKERWLNKISEQYFLVAEIENALAGFASITFDAYLDFMYMSRDYQRVGVAQKLYTELEHFAKDNHFDKITSDVSITAKPFFEKMGFELLQEQQVDIDGVKLTNYKMQKHITVR